MINFYYPRALHRSVVADVGITTPKQMAKTLIKFSAHHPQLEFSRFVIPQVPGSVARSTPVHGVVESFLKSKKYIVPSAVVSPIFAGCVAAVYVGTGAGRFNPSQQALVFNAERALEPPLGAEDRRSYQSELNHLMENQIVADPGSESAGARLEKWRRLLHDAAPEFDSQGRPVMLIPVGEEVVSVGVSDSNILGSDAPQPLMQKLLEARLRAELRKGSPPKASESDVTRDWNLLQKAMNGSDVEDGRAVSQTAAAHLAIAPGTHRKSALRSRALPSALKDQPENRSFSGSIAGSGGWDWGTAAPGAGAKPGLPCCICNCLCCISCNNCCGVFIPGWSGVAVGCSASTGPWSGVSSAVSSSGSAGIHSVGRRRGVVLGCRFGTRGVRS